jgi:Lambda phage tail tube protein, TTP
MSDAIDGFGTILKLGDGEATETFTSVAELVDINGPGIKRDSRETTHHQSADKFREYKPGLKDGGEVGYTVNLLPGNATHGTGTGGLLGTINDDELHNWELHLPPNDAGATYKWSFAGFLTSFDVKYPKGDNITADMTLKISGKPTLALVS